jgi:DNA-directed RNA polymerases I, II, and III subunit RPABC3
MHIFSVPLNTHYSTYPVLFSPSFLTSLVSRLKALGDNYEMTLKLDFNSEIYPLDAKEKIEVVLARTLQLDGQDEKRHYVQRPGKTLMDDYEYVMSGKVYKIDGPTDAKQLCAIYLSCGGLLMHLEGDPRNLQKIELDQEIFLLVKRIGKQ